MLRSASIIIILLSILILTACEPTTPVPLTSPAPTRTLSPTTTVTSLPSQPPTIRPTNTSLPTATVTATRSVTPTPAPLILPGMPGFQPTPTYDPALFPPATPSNPPLCPTVNPELPLPEDMVSMINDYITATRFDDLSVPALEFLNIGGSPEVVIDAIQTIDPELILVQDLTNDSQPELIFMTQYLSILGCSPSGSGQYALLAKLFDEINMRAPHILAIQDYNQNGSPELLLDSRAFMGFSSARFFKIYEWNGYDFQSAIGLPAGYPYETIADIEFSERENETIGIIYEAGTIELQDTDDNGVVDIIVNSDIPGHPTLLSSGPWRRGRDIFSWNGLFYVPVTSEFDTPVYRFQAIHDADQAILLGNYDQALSFYQDAIFSDLLAGWSFELYMQQMQVVESAWVGQPTPTPLPAPAEEYFHLAAYARFRILVLHALTGDLDSAQVVYNSLQEYYPAGQPGHASARLATDFWQAFQSSGDVGQACNQALALNPDVAETILPWISSDYHGWQAPRYIPVDLCPFGQTGTRD